MTTARWFCATIIAGLLLFLPGGSVTAAVLTLDPERGVITLAPLLEEATPAVVNISVSVRVPTRQNPLLSDPFFRRFFDMPDVPERPPEQEALSAGSGVIVDAGNGYVLTNHHVVANADRIQVTLKDRRRFTAELIGSDPETDIAVLKIEPGNLVALPLGDSEDLAVGDLVLAIGNPFGLGQTVTSGIVSALGRGIGMRGFEDFIQTDASINPGNSGGALINSKGELIGINTAIIGPAGGNVGIGFAVPSNMAKAVMEQIVEFGAVQRGRLGVTIQDVTPDIAEALDLKTARGALVSSVQAGSPAEEAGLKPGDIIAEIDGRGVEGSADLRNMIGLARIGTVHELLVLRGGEERRLSVQLRAIKPSLVKGAEAVPQLEGAVLQDLQPDHPQHGRVKGVVVAELEAGSPAWRAGLRQGDIVLAVNRRPVGSVDEFVAAAKQSGRAVALDILRGDMRLFLVIQ